MVTLPTYVQNAKRHISLSQDSTPNTYKAAYECLQSIKKIDDPAQKYDHEAAKQIYTKAETHSSKQQYDLALPLYYSLRETLNFSAMSLFRMAGLANIAGDAGYASVCFYKAFEIEPNLNRRLFAKEHSLHMHVYEKMDDRRAETCPLCGRAGRPYWCYYIGLRPNYPKSFNPVRTWMYCEPCHHLWSAEMTEYNEAEAPLLHTSVVTKANPGRFTAYSRILCSLREHAMGNALLEIGVGEGECISVARELLYDTTGIDLTKECVDYIKKTFQMDVIHGDFLTHPFEQLFDVIVLGDVIEHVRDPQAFIKRTAELSHKGTVLWVSTPSFESVYSLYLGHNDPMRREPSHCGYFSHFSLCSLLDAHGFDVIAYEVSAQYYGSMEVTAIKR